MTAEPGHIDDAAGLRAELERHHRSAHAWARHCCRRDRSDAEEVLQLSYLKVLDGSARFAGRSSFKTWLFGVIHKTAADQRRRHVLREWIHLRWAAEDAHREPAPAADAALDAAQRHLALERALRLLSRRQREVLLLVFYHELTVEDAAGVMEIGVGSARQHYARGKDGLRRLLSAKEPA